MTKLRDLKLDDEVGGGSSTPLEEQIDAATAKSPLVDTDTFPLTEPTTLKKTLWSTIKSTLKTYFDGLYSAIGHTHAQLHTQNTDTALGTLGTKNPPIDLDKVIYRDSISSDALVTSTWTQIKAFLKTYFDGIYQAILVSGTSIKTINSTSLLGSGDIAITSGESNTVSNVGTGDGEVYKEKVGVDLKLKTIKAGANIAIDNNTDDITIRFVGGGEFSATIPSFDATEIAATELDNNDSPVKTLTVV